mmetsp:Transcript_15511/g.31381  ORF Transcript_15511/g.31381 Transcript_15511/m.31381 type:complete len:207 (-) Transcript_15511:206-826(-)
MRLLAPAFLFGPQWTRDFLRTAREEEYCRLPSRRHWLLAQAGELDGRETTKFAPGQDQREVASHVPHDRWRRWTSETSSIGRSVIPIQGHHEFLAAMAASQLNLVVVKFYAPWCRSCKAVAARYERIAAEYPQALFFDINQEMNRDLCRQLSVVTLPTVHFYQGSAGRIESFALGPSKISILREKLNVAIRGSCRIDDRNAPYSRV